LEKLRLIENKNGLYYAVSIEDASSILGKDLQHIISETFYSK
jgi:hypothetical protein